MRIHPNRRVLVALFLTIATTGQCTASADDAVVQDLDPIVGVWHSPSNFFGDAITALLQFQPDGTVTSRDSIDFGSGNSNEYYGGNQGVWEKIIVNEDDDDGRRRRGHLSYYLARATEIVYNQTNGEPMFLSMAKSVITLMDDDDRDCDSKQPTFTGVLNILRSPCIINDCPVPDMSLVDTHPMFVINITGTKILSYNPGLLASSTTMTATPSSEEEKDESSSSSSSLRRSSSSPSDGMVRYPTTTTSWIIWMVGMLLGIYFV